MRFWASFLSTIASILLVLSVLITVTFSYVSNRNYFADQYRLLETSKQTQIPFSTLMGVTDEVLNYLENKRDDFNIKAKINGQTVSAFTKTEIGHMEDVKTLYRGGILARNVCVLVAIGFYLISALLVKHDRLLLYSRSYMRGFLIVAIILATIVVWMSIDFTSFWNTFHRVFFFADKGTRWELDPAKSLLIKMFPEQFWANLCQNIAIVTGAITGSVFVICAIFVGVKKYRRKHIMRLED